MRALIKSDLLDRTRWRSLCQILSASFQDCAGYTAGRRTSVVRTTRFPTHQMRTSLSTPSATVTDRRSPPILWPLPSLALLDFLLIAVVSFRVNEMTSPSVRFPPDSKMFSDYFRDQISPDRSPKGQGRCWRSNCWPCSSAFSSPKPQT